MSALESMRGSLRIRRMNGSDRMQNEWLPDRSVLLKL
jgi:hypothetical protein